ncbi:hypothetical protein TSMG0018 [Halocynthia phage JM-2012]|uniref:hypothetical protein n=1 Tax=Halocynthia phage JM-2012 TaxID=1173297 RepID=UPI00025C68E1|nr:hypothetical protein TSMG0018 [Halocynthia phage JM-2012]AFI55301.1 hypothetical protein TSMG0018 [Halocynthia phage JM-2012]
MAGNPSYYDINFSSATRANGVGNRETSLHNVIRSKNWVGGPPSLPVLKENTGLVFIAPPDLNLHPANIGHIREFSPLLVEDPYSLGSTIRDMLDPRGAWTKRNSMLNDPQYPFLGILDNTLTSLDGWPDYVMDEFVSTPGRAGSTSIAARGRVKKFQKFDLSATHINLPGDAINQIYSYLAHWQDKVHSWSASPHMKNVQHNRLDYAMRIYRFAFDSTGTRVNQFTMSGYGYPRSASQGAVMNYSTDKPNNQGYDTISASWSCVGAYHNDPIVLLCFNQLVERFNPLMKDGIRELTYVKVGTDTTSKSLADAATFQYHGYPRINLQTLEFEIWVPKAIFNYLKQGAISDEILLAIQRKRDDDLYAATQELTDAELELLFGQL